MWMPAAGRGDQEALDAESVLRLDRLAHLDLLAAGGVLLQRRLCGLVEGQGGEGERR